MVKLIRLDTKQQKIVLYFGNGVIAILGLIILSLAGSQDAKFSRDDGFEGLYFLSLLVLASLGLGLLVASIFGIIGLWQQNSCLLKTNYILLILTILTAIAMSVAYYMLSISTHNQTMVYNFNRAMENYATPVVRDPVDNVQKYYKCCGFNDYLDWKNTTFGINGTVPESCCLVESPNCGNGIANWPMIEASTKINIKGCDRATEINTQKLVWTTLMFCIVIGFKVFNAWRYTRSLVPNNSQGDNEDLTSNDYNRF